MKSSGLLNIGFGNFVVSNRVIAIVNPSSSPMRRLREDARATTAWCRHPGPQDRSIIINDSNHVVLSVIRPNQRQRFTQEDASDDG
jgi:regulator of extracellular matrix RemA (YlzA/DUF370 family)